MTTLLRLRTWVAITSEEDLRQDGGGWKALPMEVPVRVTSTTTVEDVIASVVHHGIREMAARLDGREFIQRISSGQQIWPAKFMKAGGMSALCVEDGRGALRFVGAWAPAGSPSRNNLHRSARRLMALSFLVPAFHHAMRDSLDSASKSGRPVWAARRQFLEGLRGKGAASSGGSSMACLDAVVVPFSALRTVEGGEVYPEAEVDLLPMWMPLWCSTTVPPRTNTSLPEKVSRRQHGIPHPSERAGESPIRSPSSASSSEESEEEVFMNQDPLPIRSHRDVATNTSTRSRSSSAPHRDVLGSRGSSASNHGADGESPLPLPRDHRRSAAYVAKTPDAPCGVRTAHRRLNTSQMEITILSPGKTSARGERICVDADASVRILISTPPKATYLSSGHTPTIERDDQYERVALLRERALLKGQLHECVNAERECRQLEQELREYRGHLTHRAAH